MYKVSGKLKVFAFVLMAIGAIGIIGGFLSTPSDLNEVKEMIAEASHGGHGESHDAAALVSHDTQSEVGHADETHGEEAHGDAHGDEHAVHVLHQLQNKPWAGLYVAAFFFFMIALGTMAFYAVQKAAQAGWSPLLYRVMEGISSYILPGGIIMFVLLCLSAFHVNHLFTWMEPGVAVEGSDNYDAIVAGKSGFLNIPFFLIRAAVFISGWILYWFVSRNYSLKQDQDPEGNRWYKKGFKSAAVFLVFFIVTESIMSWDWIMSLDPHWFSTLFGWYVFASMFVSGITTIALVAIYLKSRGFLEYVNDSHIHDLAKFMFGISIFWTYLWFSQFMLIWYANIPEEVTYFVTRIQDYNLVFFGMVAINFLFPVLVLMNSDFKRVNWFVITTGLFIIIGHYLDIFVMVMPATVGQSWFIGIGEIGAFLFFAGLFLYYIFHTIAKAPLVPTGDPFIEESKHFHY